MFDKLRLKRLKESIRLNNNKFKSSMLDIIEADFYKLHYQDKVSIYKIVEELQKELGIRVVYENVRGWVSKKKKEWNNKSICQNLVILTISKRPISLLYDLDHSIIVNLDDNIIEHKCKEIINWYEFKNTEEAQKLNISNINSLVKLLKEVGYQYILLQTSNENENYQVDKIITDKKLEKYDLLIDKVIENDKTLCIQNIELLFEIDKVKYPVTALKIKKDINRLNNRLKGML